MNEYDSFLNPLSINHNYDVNYSTIDNNRQQQHYQQLPLLIPQKQYDFNRIRFGTTKNKFQTSPINMETERIPTDIPIIQNEHSNETIDKSTPIYGEFNKVEETLLNKIDWAKNQLLNTNDVRKNIDLCELIRTASEACLSVGKLYRSQNYFTS